MSGVYIHIPFCVKKCEYCDFYSVTDISDQDRFTSALLTEITVRTPSEPQQIDTLYFGGGTPSILTEKNLNRILDRLHRRFKIHENAEITLEVNPGTVSPEKLKAFHSAGINRLNIGVQSFNDRFLQFLGRVHNGNEARSAIETAEKSGFDNIGIDLIYGVPDQTEELWHSELETATRFNLSHLSCYALTLEPGTPLHQRVEQGKTSAPDEVLTARLFENTIRFLEPRGFIHYEISNYARGTEAKSRHNLKYWNGASYIGFGPSAHSYNARSKNRSWNTSDLPRYMQEIENRQLPIEETETLTKEQQMIETLFLGLRKRDGIDIPLFNRKYRVNFTVLFGPVLRELERSGHLLLSESHCRLSEKGILFADNIAGRFIECL